MVLKNPISHTMLNNIQEIGDIIAIMECILTIYVISPVGVSSIANSMILVFFAMKSMSSDDSLLYENIDMLFTASS